MTMVRAMIIGAVIFVATTAGAQEATAISVLIESEDPAIEAPALRAALSEALDSPVAAIVRDPLLTIVGTVGPEGAASVQFIGARTETFVVPRGEPGWLLRWLREEVVRRLEPTIASLEHEQVFAESADGLASPIAPPVIDIEVSTPARITGWLNLLSVPPATVTMMGQRLGRTPMVGREMPPGTHELVLTTADGVSQAIYVTIERGRRTRRALSIR